MGVARTGAVEVDAVDVEAMVEDEVVAVMWTLAVGIEAIGL